MTESQVLERIVNEDRYENGTMTYRHVSPEKLAALLAEMSNRIEQLENRPVDAVSPQMTHVVGTPNITPVVELGSAPEGLHFKVTSKSYGPGENPSR